MRFRPLRFLITLFLLLPCLGALAVYLAFDGRAAVERSADFTPDNIERAKRIVESNDPRRLRNGTVRTVRVTADDLDLALNYLMHRYADGSGQATLSAGRVRMQTSLPAPNLPLHPFINISAEIVQGTPLPTIARVRVGQLPLPPWLAIAVIRRAATLVFAEADQQGLLDAIRSIEFDEREARITYQWHSDLADTVRGALIRTADRERLEEFQQTLADTTLTRPSGPMSLTTLMQPLFARAVEQSRDSDPVTENRAAIFVLTIYVLGVPLREVVPEAADWPRPRRHAVTLNDRDDSAKHFMVSAMLAANTGGPFADAVGIYKEVADARGGSGFSFNDLAADRAGRRLGELAEQPSAAMTLQARLSGATAERQVMPEAADLPDSVSEADLTRRFGGLNGPGYQRLVAEIDRRIAGLALYR